MFWVVDLSTTYHVVRHVPSHLPTVVAEAFNDAWVAWAGTPFKVQLDPDGAFKSQFGEALEAFGV